MVYLSMQLSDREVQPSAVIHLFRSDPTPSTTLPTLAQRSDVLVAFSQFWEEQCERDSSRQELLSS